MRLIDLSLQNIGPFDDATLQFLSGEPGEVPVAIITGENGSGKTILLDAIRGLFGEQYGHLERAIWREHEKFQLSIRLSIEGKAQSIVAHSRGRSFDFATQSWIRGLPHSVQDSHHAGPNWIVDFWRSAQPNDGYSIKNLVRYNPRSFLMNALKGIQRNASVTELICHFDYLRSSDDPKEKADGKILYQTMREIFRVSLLDGELSHVRRTDFTPLVKQSGQLVPLANLSSGNAYLVQHLISLLGKMYAVHILRDTPPEDLCKTPGLLLIDEAENHLHPRWQKRFLGDVLRIFPNLQIIATTHSPFIVASVKGAKVFVCRYDRDRKTCVVDDETRNYENKPIEEILLSPAFEETQPFGTEMTELIEARKRAVEAGDEEQKEAIEAQLKERNPEYFSFLDLDERIEALRGKAS